jgi:hypothetical protein
MTTLTMKEEKREEALQRVLRGELTVMAAAMVVGASERRCYRNRARVTKNGALRSGAWQPGAPPASIRSKRKR